MADRVFGEHRELLLDPDAGVPGATRPLDIKLSHVVIVALGAIVGTCARYAITRAWPAPPVEFPYAILTINLSGSFVLGAVLEALARRGEDHGTRRLFRLCLGTGFCGAFTTYSTFAVEIDLLCRSHRFTVAVTYALLSILGGLATTVAGIVIAAGHHQHRSKASNAISTDVKVA